MTHVDSNQPEPLEPPAQVEAGQPAGVIKLSDNESYPHRGPWIDAWRRLRRNRAALAGMVIIFLNIMVAVFASRIAPYSYRDQELYDQVTKLRLNDSAPEWVLTLFSTMNPIKKDYWTFEGKAGDVVNVDVGSPDITTGMPTVGAAPAGFTTNVQVLSKDGESLGAKQGTSFDFSSQIKNIELPYTGTYTVIVQRQIKGETGDYALLISPSDMETEVADCTDCACTITPGHSSGIAKCGGVEYGQKVYGSMSGKGYVRVDNDYALGTDNLGRDLLSRIIYGARVSLAVAFVGPMMSLLVGTIFGLVSGYAGGWMDNFMMRIVDTMYAFPTILFIILMMAYFRASFTVSEPGTFAYRINEIDEHFGGMMFIFIGVGLTSWMGTARLARGQVLSIREKEYIEAAVSIGTSHRVIIFRHILPNILGPIVVAETLTIPTYISFEAFLSFIGLGVNRPTPSWGSMIADGAETISTYPYQAIFPAMALFFIIFAFNFLGDGLRDALDPHTTR